MQFVQPFNGHNGVADPCATKMYLPGMTGNTGRINYTIRRNDHVLDEDNYTTHFPTKVLRVAPNESNKSLKEATQGESSRHLWRTCKALKASRKKNVAATMIQRLVRGHCARTKTYIKRLERKLSRIQRQTKSELCEIEEFKNMEMLKMRQKVTKSETMALKAHMACAETANQGVQLIRHLRHENKKLRDKNDKIARAIAELTHQNKRLDKAASMTVSNESLLSDHYGNIKTTNKALTVVVPQYEKKLKEMNDALDIRCQYWTTERKMKILYVKLVGTLLETLEDRCKDKDLVDSVVSMCIELKDTLPKALLEEQSEQEKDEVVEESEYEDESESDSNDYDEYDIADFNQSSKTLY